jgi:acyl-CoA thioesterase YciA
MELITQHLCLEKDVGAHGNLFGGILMAWLDEAAAILASQTAKSNRLVTIVADQIKFIQPVKVGDIARIFGKVKEIGNTSITIELSVDATDPETGSNRTVCQTNMIFVNIDKWGNKAPIKN